MSRYESRDVAAAARRMANALVRRAAHGDEQALIELVALQDAIGHAIGEAGARLHAHYSWTELGDWTGVTRQAARQRFGPIEDRLKKEDAVAEHELAGELDDDDDQDDPA